MLEEDNTKIFINKNLKIFLAEYNEDEKEKYWNDMSQEFFNFWNNKIRNKDYILQQNDTDFLVRIIDSKARGHKPSDEAIARTGIYQSLWEKAFKDLKSNFKLQNYFDEIINTHSVKELIPLVDKFLIVNKDNSNGLNGHGANMINAFLFLKNPNIFLSVLSLNHRKLIMDKFEVGNFNIYKTQGEKIVKSNFDLLNNFNKKYHVNLTPRCLSEFLYTPHGAYTIAIKKTWYKGSSFKYYTVREKDIRYKIKISKLELQQINAKKSLNKISSTHDYICSQEKEKNKQENRSRKGLMGEDIVLNIEKQRLSEEGLLNLSKKVKKVSDNYSLGYDIISYELDGAEKHIEVKSTSGSLKHNEFYITRNELEKSKVIKNYYIYFVYRIDENPEVKFLKYPDLGDPKFFDLVPQHYIVRYKSKK